jgi:flagellar assembly factor FliW
LGPDYPRPDATQIAHDAGLGSSDVAVLVIVAANKGRGLVANMLAPLIIDRSTRTGAQIVLDPRLYSAEAQLRPPTQLIEAQR